jgi:hypothetical protein
MRPDSIRRWRSRMARELGLSQPLSHLQRHLLTDLYHFRRAAEHGPHRQSGTRAEYDTDARSTD